MFFLKEMMYYFQSTPKEFHNVCIIIHVCIINHHKYSSDSECGQNVCATHRGAKQGGGEGVVQGALY